MRYAYRLTNGLAHDLRYVKQNYVLQPGELEGQAEPLPNPDAISVPAAVAARNAAKVAKDQQDVADGVEREQAKQDAQLQAFLNRTPGQINNFIDSTATDLAGVRTVLKLLARMLVVVARMALR